MEPNAITEKIIGAAIEVHRMLGPGLLESAYEECLAKEFELVGLKFERQKALPLEYKGLKLDAGYRLNFFVEDEIVVELKAVDTVLPIFTAQALTYLRLLSKPIALIINFNVPVLYEGIKRVANNYKEASASLR